METETSIRNISIDRKFRSSLNLIYCESDENLHDENVHWLFEHLCEIPGEIRVDSKKSRTKTPSEFQELWLTCPLSKRRILNISFDFLISWKKISVLSTRESLRTLSIRDRDFLQSVITKTRK